MARNSSSFQTRLLLILSFFIVTITAASSPWAENEDKTAGEAKEAGLSAVKSVAVKYTKIDITGKELPSDAPLWAAVRDNETGLVWEVKEKDGSVRDMDKLFTWKEAVAQLITELNESRYAGFDDWRMPTDIELRSLRQREKMTPAIDTAYFPNTAPSTYWNYYICGDGSHITQKMEFGEERVKGGAHRARAVRGKELTR